MDKWILGEKFNTVYPHHGSIESLWEKKWKSCCEKSIYPFHDGAFEDFVPIFEWLIQHNVKDCYSDSYTKAFLSTAEYLSSEARLAEERGEIETAVRLGLRSACVFRISRFPYLGPQHTGLKRHAFELQKEVYLRTGALMEYRIEEKPIEFSHRLDHEGMEIPVLQRLPAGHGDNPHPVILVMTGLDGYRVDNTALTDRLIQKGWAVVLCEIPGTADCPADPKDASSPDRLWTSVIEWIREQSCFDLDRIVAWGLSAGGYYAARIAFTHARRLLGAVAQGAGTHHFLSPQWLSRADGHEYPCSVTHALASKYGFDTVDELKSHGQEKFSLVLSGITKLRSCQLLLINGEDDGLCPIEDLMELADRASGREMIIVKNRMHMGNPDAQPHVIKWLTELLD
ncbi:conidial pigment biosynthesis Ayg1 [Fusarium pseudoanthophilum]|uniref:Conidial pigment biosynthesis Ayg1 n=1 Tax=Fusarium pseudoanthophilum TaxID=48495 RepID=A0A8H5P858_9HYPO|nr:conidial pigment biosynthesis Ayg1 [Fusarium pseudoanthophilum]